ncbi:metallophosphatase family protein [Vibrio tubiashii]|uniref:metallophosphoesterase family protein n=1 Tax=Vibrio tubiashii TaxID=29498 RepID=UPI001EFCA28C|nr:metallophosphoesterase family protein [Vibrio tubiashii]MCG9584138.1 metallophosphatase family protein [Vibrio tubiashii]MCG9617733.1 metallophosphatase family protein [Vibrio tubiashii]MCG9689531.1 metallophosphatase family protein [Vibrio tubiashii]
MIAIISDVHGNLPALRAVLKDIEKYNVNKIISLGDVAGYYPFVDECISLFRENNIVNLMGNHDFYLVSGLGCPRSKSVNELSKVFERTISPESMSYLEASRICLREGDAIMVHAGFNNPIDEYLYSLSDAYFNKFNFKYFFSGHTHVQHLELFDNGQLYCNPGSVGQPRDGITTASYALFNQSSSEVALKRVAYDPSSVILKLKEEGFSEHYYKNLLNGSRIGGKIDKTERKT